MHDSYRITALGEALIDFTEVGLTEDGRKLFEQNAGGAPANVVMAAQKLGAQTAFIGKVGADMHGEFLRSALGDAGVDTTGLIKDAHVFTTLAFVALDEHGERTFSFSRKPGADTCLESEELPLDVIESSRVFHVGSLSLTDEPARSATLAALDLARRSGCTLSYDPNYRGDLWKSETEAIANMRSVINRMDLMKISNEECELLCGTSDPIAASAFLVEQGVKIAVVTLGSSGAYVRCNQSGAFVDGFPASVVDTTGAGDAFWGGFLTAYCENATDPQRVSLEQACSFTRFGNAAAALCIQKRGAIPALPSRLEVEKLLASA